MIRNLLKRLLGPILQSFAAWYFKKPRAYSYKNIRGIVLPGVFYPHLTISTKLLLEFLETKDLKKQSFLELGCGTGMISVFAAKKGAQVTASDINPKAIENATLNATKNNVNINAVKSDLFSQLQSMQFDYIVINPPYYPKNASDMAENAWFCGEDFGYFKRLFEVLKHHIHQKSKVYMILSEDCDLERISNIAKAEKFGFKTEVETKKWGERNFIFSIAPNHPF